MKWLDDLYENPLAGLTVKSARSASRTSLTLCAIFARVMTMRKRTHRCKNSGTVSGATPARSRPSMTER